LTGFVQLALEVRLVDFQITKRHPNVFVTHKLHENGHANATAEQVRGPGVAQAVRGDGHRVGATHALGSVGQD
jgi:hypothetical protein